MKPNFALDLSHDGIGLLHRGADGWHTVGNVSLDDPEFSEKLGFLRQTATALENGGVTSKLVIPNTQILFTTVDAPGPTAPERDSQIRAALDGTTPYNIDDLVFDWSEIDGIVHVAAVARETLDEAEGFANEYGFNPVSFVATPKEGRFATVEPFFGPSQSATTLLGTQEEIEPDNAAIRILGAANLPENDAPITETTEQEPVIETKAIDAEIADIEAKDTAVPEDIADREPVEPQVATVPDPTPEPPQETTTDNNTSPDTKPSVISPELPDQDNPTADIATPTFASQRKIHTEPDDTQALARIEKIESRLAILPDGTTSRVPKLGGVSRKVPKDSPEPASYTPPAAQPEADQTPAVVQPATQPIPQPAPQPVATIDLTETQQPAPYPEVKTEEQAMTVFGARKKTAQRGKPRHLGLGLMLLLLAVLGGVVLWSTFFLDEETAFWRSGEPTEITNNTDNSNPTSVSGALALLTEPTLRRAVPSQEIVAPAPITAPAPIAAPIAAPEAAPLTAPIALMSPQAAEAAYLDSGIWQRGPKAPLALREDGVETLYITSIDPQIVSQDAVALPHFAGSGDDFSLEVQSTPAAHSTAFELDARGLVIPSLEGTMSPQGVMVFAGPPPTKPKARGNRVPQLTVEPDLRLAGFKPKARPANLVAQTAAAQETEQLGGYTRIQLAALRPKPRPYVVSLPQHVDETTPDDLPAEQTQPEGPVSELAVVLSSAPKHRPRNFAKLVERTRATAPTERATAAVAVPRKQTVAPSSPTRASVARLATTKNAINLRRTSLIGVYGSPSKRRALVRLSSGRYVKVKVGERVDGGKVAAIGQSELRYVKGGRTIILRMPKT